jgi:transposase
MKTNNNPLMTINNVSKEASHRNATGVIDQGRQKVAPMIKLGLDVHIASIVAVVQEGALPPKPARRLSRDQLLALVGQQVERGAAVHCVQESCGFGFVLHRELIAAGAQSMLITPIRLDEARRGRKTDRQDARALCLRLSRFLDGHHDELQPIRIPTIEEERRREVSRRREFIQRQIRRLDNRGRAVLLEHRYQSLPAGWWGPRKWKKTQTLLDDWLCGILSDLRKLLLELKTQLDALTAQLEQRVRGQQLPKGLGALTMAVLDGEVCSWDRFKHRKAPASYTGCCPSEHSSGPNQRYGSIDRHGNPRVRTQLVEAVWRLLRHQPRWHARLKMTARLADSVAQRKKVIVALARQLAIDLWRWRTGRCSLEELGLISIEAGAERVLAN